MGRKYKSIRNKYAQKRREGKEKSENPVEPVRTNCYKDIIKENEKFVQYYKRIQICSQTEWEKFIEALRSDLPTTFRISSCRSTTKKMLEIIKNDFFDNESSTSQQTFNQPICLSWYPNELAWQLNITRKSIRRLENHYKLHNFLIAETKVGSISRQEAVSMIPPIILDVQPHHKVLDTCAAPGSKTAQLIEALHSGEADTLPSGFVIANDIDNARCYMLVHQAKRLNSPCFMVINEDSSCLPKFRTNNNQFLKFDRILCDVPCSGDGTMRKNPDIWKKWHPGNALNLHGIQYRIARRAAELLEIDGRMVYSTCSLNPIENEAVLHRLLKESEGAMELVDIGYLVPGLKYLDGISVWEVTDKECHEFYQSYDDVPEQLRTTIRPQMFPPTKENAHQFCLNKSIRILPHFQNTGGFFVAALTKKNLLPWEKKIELEPRESIPQMNSQSPQPKKKRFFGHKEDPFVFFNGEEEIWNNIKSFYDINENNSDFFKPTQLLTRSSTGKKKNIYFCSDGIKDLVKKNDDRVKIINTGVKVFSRCNYKSMECDFRIVNDGLNAIKGVFGDRRKIEVTKNDFIFILERTDPKNPAEYSLLSEKVKSIMKDFDAGSCILFYKDQSGLELNVVGWKGSQSLRAYVDINEAIHLLRLLGADVSKFEINKFTPKVE